MAGADSLGRLTLDDTALIVIDVQEKFQPAIHGMDGVENACARLVRGCRELGAPILVTEQYPEGLGRTVPRVAEALGDFEPMIKMAFSLFRDDAISRAIVGLGRRNLLLVGVEAHVCLIQTALDALDAGFGVHWISDGISSRAEASAEAAARRAVQCGAFMATAEMALFQMLETAGHGKFRTISKIVK